MVASQDLKSQVTALGGDGPWPGGSVCAERDDSYGRASSPRALVTTFCGARTCGFILGGCSGWG